jgi:hypothetical protein
LSRWCQELAMNDNHHLPVLTQTAQGLHKNPAFAP